MRLPPGGPPAGPTETMTLTTATTGETASSAPAGAAPVQLVSFPLPPDLAMLAVRLGPAGLRARSTVTWERPDRGEALFGIGEALRLRGPAGESIGAAAAVLRSVARRAQASAVDPAARPRFFGGGRFQLPGACRDDAWRDFGGWQFVVPRFLLAARGESLEGSVTLLAGEDHSAAGIEAGFRRRLLDAGDAPVPRGASAAPAKAAPGLSADAWRDAVGSAITEIADGRYRKVVLARQVLRETAAAPAAIVSRLAERYPRCFVFSFAAAGATWLGASPELLVRVDRRSVFTASVAGSRPREATVEEDERASVAFLCDPKIREEHRIVVEDIAATIAPLCGKVTAPGEPALMRLPNIEHLYTPINATARPGTDVLDFVARLHPTPAVGGWPRAAAAAAIERLEEMDRGWYAAPIGWMDFAGDGEFAVGLRSALVAGGEARLFAGAGIVSGSVPAVELEETDAKLAPILQALAG